MLVQARQNLREIPGSLSDLAGMEEGFVGVEQCVQGIEIDDF